jgi:hypothetical protein
VGGCGVKALLVRRARERPREAAREEDGLLVLGREGVRERPREMVLGETGPMVMERELPRRKGFGGEAGERLRLGLGLSDGRVRLGGGKS